MLSVKIDPATKKAHVEFSCEVDLLHALRTETETTWELYVDGKLHSTYRTEEEANNAPMPADVKVGVRVKKTERRVVDDAEVERHVLAEVHDAFRAAVTAHAMDDAKLAEELEKKQAELDAHRRHRPQLAWKK